MELERIFAWRSFSFSFSIFVTSILLWCLVIRRNACTIAPCSLATDTHSYTMCLCTEHACSRICVTHWDFVLHVFSVTLSSSGAIFLPSWTIFVHLDFLTLQIGFFTIFFPFRVFPVSCFVCALPLMRKRNRYIHYVDFAEKSRIKHSQQANKNENFRKKETKSSHSELLVLMIDWICTSATKSKYKLSVQFHLNESTLQRDSETVRFGQSLNFIWKTLLNICSFCLSILTYEVRTIQFMQQQQLRTDRMYEFQFNFFILLNSFGEVLTTQ